MTSIPPDADPSDTDAAASSAASSPDMGWLDGDLPFGDASNPAPVRAYVPGQQPSAPAVHASSPPQSLGTAPAPALSYQGPAYGDPYAASQTRKKGLALASFVIGCVADVVLVAMVIVAGVASDSARSTASPTGSANVVVFAGCSLVIALGANCVGLTLGLVSVFQRQRRNRWGIFGVILNGGVLLLIGGLMLLGFAVG